VTQWGEFETAEPDLADFGANLLVVTPAYLSTVRADGVPRVHPVTPIIGGGRLFVFMEPTSPKGRDLDERAVFAMHNGVPDMQGTGGEFWISGRARRADDDASRDVATAASRYKPEERYVLFELDVEEARANGYGDVTLPDRCRWRAGAPPD
jgi:hypothetical protein